MMIMSLKGGLPINQFARVSGIGRYAGGQAPYGRKVRFLNRSGYVSELEEAQQHFNTVMFADIEE